MTLKHYCSALAVLLAALLLGCGGGPDPSEHPGSEGPNEHSSTTENPTNQKPGPAHSPSRTSGASRILQGPDNPAVADSPEPGDLSSRPVTDEVIEPPLGTRIAARRFIVSFQSDTSQAKLRDLLERYDLWKLRELDSDSLVFTVITADHPLAGASGDRLSVPDSASTPTRLQQISDPAVNPLREKMRALLDERETVSVEYDVKLEPHLTPDDPDYNQQGWLSNAINSEPAWDRTTGTPDKAIAILDTGVSFSHPDLDVNESESEDFWQNTDPGTGGDASCSGHGTGAAGMAVAIGNNSTGVAGPDWQAELVSLRIAEGNNCGLFRSSSTDALNHVASVNNDSDPDNDIDMASMSYGGAGFSSAENSAATDAYNSGALLFASAGNDGKDTDLHPSYPAGYTSVAQISALDESLNRAVWNSVQSSNYGSDTEASGQGKSTWTTSFNPNGNNDGYGNFGGTSAASPSVAGVAMLAWGLDSDLPNNELRDLVHDTGLNINEQNPQTAGELGRAIEATRLVRTLDASTAHEPNDSLSDAASVNVGPTHQAWVRSSTDSVDWFAFDLTAGNDLVFTVDWTNIAVDIDIGIYDSDGNLLRDGFESGEHQEEITYENFNDQTVYLKVEAVEGGRAAFDLTADASGFAITLDSVTPGADRPGDVITLDGNGFGTRDSDDFVRFNDGSDNWVNAQNYTAWTDTLIQVEIPDGAHTDGNGVQVIKGDTTSNTKPFEVHPRIDSVNPAEARLGDEVTINGAGFDDLKEDEQDRVRFHKKGGGWVEAGVNSWSHTQITATVPDPARSSDSAGVSVVKDSDTSNNKAFTLLPTIQSVSPAAVQPGEQITLGGAGFTANRDSGDLVRFADGTSGWVLAAEYLDWGKEEVSVRVPEGAQSSADGISLIAGGEESNLPAFEVVPRIDSVDTSPQYQWGDELTIEGAGFGLDRSGSQVVFPRDATDDAIADLPEDFVSWSDSEIVVKIPDGSHTGPLYIEKAGHASNSSEAITILLPAPSVNSGNQF